jgi:hypothetical protein
MSSLSDPIDQQKAAALTKAAIAQRAYDRKLERVAAKARAMNRAFKGIYPGRRQHVENAARAEGLIQ